MARTTAELSIEEIRKRYLASDKAVSPQILKRLQRDPRQGARALYQTLKRRYELTRRESLRLQAMRHFELVLWKSGVTHIAGVDEAGCGPLAGPVVAAAVVFPPDTQIEGIDDSKKLDAPTREALALRIRDRASGIGVGVATVEEIDAINIYHAALLAMRRAVEALPQRPQHILVDARTVPGVDIPQNKFDKGDGINFTIAAASIIAKTERDRMMDALDREHPGYGFAGHKGYATPEHRRALAALGPSPVHRKSFPVIDEMQGGFSPLFYVLKKQVFEAKERTALADAEAAVASHEPDLPERECNRLKLIVGRRWKTFG
jgi:ribonuclease HII